MISAATSVDAMRAIFCTALPTSNSTHMCQHQPSQSEDSVVSANPNRDARDGREALASDAATSAGGVPNAIARRRHCMRWRGRRWRGQEQHAMVCRRSSGERGIGEREKRVREGKRVRGGKPTVSIGYATNSTSCSARRMSHRRRATQTASSRRLLRVWRRAPRRQQCVRRGHGRRYAQRASTQFAAATRTRR